MCSNSTITVHTQLQLIAAATADESTIATTNYSPVLLQCNTVRDGLGARLNREAVMDVAQKDALTVNGAHSNTPLVAAMLSPPRRKQKNKTKTKEESSTKSTQHDATKFNSTKSSSTPRFLEQ